MNGRVNEVAQVTDSVPPAPSESREHSRQNRTWISDLVITPNVVAEWKFFDGWREVANGYKKRLDYDFISFVVNGPEEVVFWFELSPRQSASFKRAGLSEGPEVGNGIVWLRAPVDCVERTQFEPLKLSVWTSDRAGKGPGKEIGKIQVSPARGQ
jgi:hypothetical protein